MMRQKPGWTLLIFLTCVIGFVPQLQAVPPELPNLTRINVGAVENPRYPLGESWTLQVFDELGEPIGFSEDRVFGAGDFDLRLDTQVAEHPVFDMPPGRYYFQLCTGDEYDRQHKPVYCMGQWVDVDFESEIDLQFCAWQLIESIERFKVGKVEAHSTGQAMGKLMGDDDGEVLVSLWSSDQFVRTTEIGDDGMFWFEEVEGSSGENQLSFLVEGLFFDSLRVRVPDTFFIQTVVYVDKDAQGNESGKSWQDAVKNPADALDAWYGSYFKPEIHIAEGVYPVRLANIFLEGDIQIYGGFVGNEQSRDQRNPKQNTVILTGDIDDNDFRTGGVTYTASDIRGSNATTLFVWTRSSPRAVLDGLTITGYAGSDGAVGLSSSCETTIRNVKFIGNQGRVGAAINASPGSRTRLKSCWFEGNEAGYGGAIFIGFEQWPAGATRTSAMDVHDCTFLQNEATETHGGAIFCEATPSDDETTVEFFMNITNSRFLGNKANGQGAAIACSSNVPAPIRASVVNCMFSGNASTVGAVLSSSLTHRDGMIDIKIVNCTMNHNRGNYGETIYNDVGIHTAVPTQGSTISIENSILWSGKYTIPPHGEFYNQGQTAKLNFKNNIIYGGVQNTAMILNKYGATHSDQGGNLGHLPRFQDPDGPDGIFGTLDDDLELKSTSPGIDSGGNINFSQYRTATDLAGRPRWHNTVDRGAYEH